MSEQKHQDIKRLQELRDIAKKGGGESKIQRQRQRGKLTVRERLDMLFDKDTFLETGILATDEDKNKPDADGIVTGYGKVDGRYVGIIAYDYTVKGNSMGRIGEEKATRIREITLKSKIPMVWIMDSGGARIRPSEKGGFGGTGEQIAFFANSGWLFKEESLMSGIIPLVGAMMGAGICRHRIHTGAF
ncbi:hypothetical protein B9J77_01755 [candidate division NPL-UPA2 bacterium Unc8]|uniref:CoA carboxyltransferase N-terminal domain-containing protein n=1 Tax=candidate division NPL-UPA2 bacterium Unc8 TaxID=1980939 RepID=A0A399FX17_UNCN2|nr:Propionyl-CoA carboxylase beta chain [Bacillota bacterium]RII00764.1 MAG: hypothetical protein B9J77_01755 [candidate division NPL-UPA2 bacterium Unc8]